MEVFAGIAIVVSILKEKLSSRRAKQLNRMSYYFDIIAIFI